MTRYKAKILITITVMLVTILEVLDITIVNVALPPMMGSLGANTEEITWILTTYIVAAAVFMPLTGLLIERLGQKKLLIANIIGFCISSMLCGLSTSLFQMILFRTFQGMFGASLVPLSQFILRNTYSEAEQGKAMAMWGMGVMVAPVLGPTLGGYITEALNWRWVFFINLPVCIIALLLTIYFIKETPSFKKKIDWLGLLLMILSIGAFQLFLDQGNSKDWFDSSLIFGFFITTILASVLFIFHSKNNNNSIIDISLFANKNFLLCCLLMMGYMISLFGVISIQPMMLENLMNYPIEYAGLLMAPRGIASALAMAVVASFIPRTNPKHLIFASLIISFISGHFMADFQLQTSEFTMIWVGALQGFGMGLFFVPVSMLALAKLKKEQMGEASGIFSLGRSIGSSIGISIISMLAARETQINWHSLGAKISTFNPNLQQFLDSQNLDINSPFVIKMLANKVLLQANFNAFIDCFLLSSYGFLLLIPLVALLDVTKTKSKLALSH